jgi:hypothetical protein
VSIAKGYALSRANQLLSNSVRAVGNKYAMHLEVTRN